MVLLNAVSIQFQEIIINHLHDILIMWNLTKENISVFYQIVFVRENLVSSSRKFCSRKFSLLENIVLPVVLLFLCPELSESELDRIAL